MGTGYFTKDGMRALASGDLSRVYDDRSFMLPLRDLFEDLDGGGEVCGEAVRLYKKRIKCNCLNEKWSEAKKKPRLGNCSHWHCGVQKDRKELKICTCCGFNQYCSKECQRADWPKHRTRMSTKTE